MKDVDGTEYLQYSERQTKTKTGEEPRNIRAVKSRAFSTPNNLPAEKNPVFVYKVYSEKRPPSMQDANALFYLAINHIKNPAETNKSWFKSSGMGVNKIGLMKTMAEKARIDMNRRLTNHSGRKTIVQKLSDKGVPPTHIIQVSGHRNIQSNYSTISKEKQKSMSLI